MFLLAKRWKLRNKNKRKHGQGQDQGPEHNIGPFPNSSQARINPFQFVFLKILFENILQFIIINLNLKHMFNMNPFNITNII